MFGKIIVFDAIIAYYYRWMHIWTTPNNLEIVSKDYRKFSAQNISIENVYLKKKENKVRVFWKNIDSKKYDELIYSGDHTNLLEVTIYQEGNLTSVIEQIW